MLLPFCQSAVQTGPTLLALIATSEAENPQLGRGILLSPVENPDGPQSRPHEPERARNAYAVGMDTIETSLSGSRSLTVGRRTVVGLLVGGASGSLAAACAPWTAAPPTTPGARLQHPITYVAMGASDAAGVGGVAVAIHRHPNTVSRAAGLSPFNNCAAGADPTGDVLRRPSATGRERTHRILPRVEAQLIITGEVAEIGRAHV